MKNKFPVRSCCYCKAEVPPGAGTVWKWRGRWYGKHAGCKKPTPLMRVGLGTSEGQTAPSLPNLVPFPGATASPLESSVDAAAEWEVDAARVEREFEEANDRSMAGVRTVNF